ncbi:hypothetical protein P691DRAFT_543423 [Macrolepiota fuliginosa MF-IS2]|uniref:Uncharacterized protein n=1 Tax=Macrolepiota fuliginosa MF-IS2 TaxID=1400762 RepID=A0A9P6C5A8_9AGAR|nr:hypothetical protein P691DRAFT_543423 [Macrolepiota fuliginosa MF-IS2]
MMPALLYEIITAVSMAIAVECKFGCGRFLGASNWARSVLDMCHLHSPVSPPKVSQFPRQRRRRLGTSDTAGPKLSSCRMAIAKYSEHKAQATLRMNRNRKITNADMSNFWKQSNAIFSLGSR